MKFVFRLSAVFLCCALTVLSTFATPKVTSTENDTKETQPPSAETSIISETLSNETEVFNNMFIKFANKQDHSITTAFITNSTVENGVWSFTGTNNDPRITIPLEFEANNYSSVQVRMKWDGIPRADVSNPFAQLFYSGFDKDGNAVKINAAYSVKVNAPLSSDGKYKVITFPLTAANLDGMKITTLYLDPIVSNGDVTLDYLMVVAKNETSAYEWNFDKDGDWGTLTPSNPKVMTVSDGSVNFSGPYTATQLHLNDISISADDYAGFEFVMKHSLNVTSAQSKLYFKGVNSSGTPFGFDEVYRMQYTYTSTSSDDGYNYYFYDFSKCSPIKGATITNIRFDPIKADASYSIEYIRLVPKTKLAKTPLDGKNLVLNYSFEDTKSGTADGTISIDFGEQDAINAKTITLKWANKNTSGEYIPLEDYSIIKVLDGEYAKRGYTLNKDLLIPTDATALIAEIIDCEKTFIIAYDIPESKRKKDRGQPLYVTGFISDTHVGGWGSETEPNVRLIAAKDQLSELCDFVVIVGDLTQWYGAYSGEEFKAYNYDGSKYTDNGEKSPEYLGIGQSQWTVLFDYLDSFNVPVYAVQGNHDIRDKDSWSTMIESQKYWRPFLEDWVNHSNTANDNQKYATPAKLHDDNNYYDTVINGHHYIFLTIPKVDAPYYYFGDEQLKWLDRKLYESEESGKPIFVFGHIPLNKQWDAAIGDKYKLDAIFANHPNAIYISGHTHYSLDVDFVSSIDGKQETVSYIHDGGTTTINIPNDESNPDETTEISGSHGVVAKVFNDGIEIWSRDFVTGKWISRGYTALTFKEKCEIPQISVTKSFDGDSIILSANVPDGIGCSWSLNGTISDETSSSITISKDYEGFIAIRYSDDNGNYRSQSYESIDDIPETDIVISEKTVSMRVQPESNASGIRFAATISNENKAIVSEYGFIATRKSVLDGIDAGLTFDLKDEAGNPLYVYGVNYQKDSDGNVKVDNIYGLIEGGVKFAGVMTGINVNMADQICETIIARPYAKISENGQEKIVYGEAVGISLKEVAAKVREKDEETYNANKEFIDLLADA